MEFSIWNFKSFKYFQILEYFGGKLVDKNRKNKMNRIYTQNKFYLPKLK